MDNLSQIKHYLAEADPVMAKLIVQYPLQIPQQAQPVYNDLCSAIISQQLSVKAAANIEHRYLQLFGGQHPHPPTLLETPIENLRACGISNSKANYLQNIARYWLQKQLHSWNWVDKANEEIINELTQIKGVGRWTADMVLMFTLLRPDVLPLGDLGIRKAIAQNYQLSLEDKDFLHKATQIAAVWQPYRTIACRYLWKSLDNK